MCTQEESFIETIKEIQPNSVSESSFQDKCVIKLWVADILCLQKHKEVEGAYDFNGTVVRIVDIFGIITNIQMYKNKRVIYKVDDGTGEIWCFHDLGKYQEELESVTSDCADVPAFPCSNESSSTDSFMFSSEDSTAELETDATEWLQKQFQEAAAEFVKPYEVGETVHVVGKLNDYREDLEIYIYNIRCVKDLCHEVDRMYEMLYLYRKHYDKLGNQKKRKILSKTEIKELLSGETNDVSENPECCQQSEK